MDVLVMAIVLLVVAAFVGLVDRYEIQRTYADAYAARHGHIPRLSSGSSSPTRIRMSSTGVAATEMRTPW
jgi:hypothetical protein